MNYQIELEFAKRLARQAGKIMLKYFDHESETEIKSDNTPVTIADKEVNQMVIDEVKKHFPEDGVYGEEDSFGKDRARLWVCDPIDGTSSFAMSVPIAVFSLALVVDGEPVLGVIYDPFLDKLYEATVGCGAWCNGGKLSVSTDRLDKLSRINVNWWPNEEYDVLPKAYELSQATGCRVSSMGSAAKAGVLVANGQLAATIFPGKTDKNVDVAAVKVIVEEAGGKTTDLFGKDQRYNQSIQGFIASNGLVHDGLVELFKESK